MKIDRSKTLALVVLTLVGWQTALADPDPRPRPSSFYGDGNTVCPED